MKFEILDMRYHPQLKDAAVEWFVSKWGIDKKEYEKSFDEMYSAKGSIPLWFIALGERGDIVGGCGVIENDFVDRTDLFPYLCALFIEPEYRGHAFGSRLLARARLEAARGGFDNIYLCTDHVGYYEKYGWEYIAVGNHPWGETSRIYRAKSTETGKQ